MEEPDVCCEVEREGVRRTVATAYPDRPTVHGALPEGAADW